MIGRQRALDTSRAALAGLLAGALAIGAAELVAGLLGRAVAPEIVVGGAAIDRTPRFLKEFAIRTFGENDKKVLLAGVFVTIAVIAAAVGVIATHRRRLGLTGVGLLGVVAAGAALSRPTARPLDVLPSLTAIVVGVLALGYLTTAFNRPAAGGVVLEDAAQPPIISPRRRGVLVGGGAAVLAAASGFGGRAVLSMRNNVAASRSALSLPEPASPAPALSSGAQLKVSGISPFFTPPKDFYRVDTALSVPRLTTDDWQLKIHGMVGREVNLSFDDLLAQPIVEHDITLTCVSNEVGGPLLGTARWLGVELAPLLARAGVKPGADQLVGTSVDGMTIGTPIAAITDGRAAMLAIAMNGEPLLPEHGFPVRMIVPGLYGYVSATKWLVDLEVTSFGAFDPYWVRRGWAQQAPIKTGSRIDTPKPLARVKPGRTAVAGVAWAQHRGISAVQVSVDSGAWQEAELSAPVNTDLWRQWVWPWDAAPGSHTLRVRAIDAAGNAQPEERVPPFPNGSTGWQSLLVTVTD